MNKSKKDLSSHHPHLMFLSILVASVLKSVSYLYMTPSGIVNLSNNSKWFHLAFLIKTTHLRESQLSLQFGTTVCFVGVNNFGSREVGIVRTTIHLDVPRHVLLFPPKLLSGWKKDTFWPFVPALQTSGRLVGASSSYWTGTTLQ